MPKGHRGKKHPANMAGNAGEGYMDRAGEETEDTPGPSPPETTTKPTDPITRFR